VSAAGKGFILDIFRYIFMRSMHLVCFWLIGKLIEPAAMEN